MKKVWVIVDDEYGPQAVFSNEKAAEYSAAHDKAFAQSGMSPVAIEFWVHASPTVPYRKSKKKRKAK